MKLINFSLLIVMLLVLSGCSKDEETVYRDDLTSSVWHKDIDDYQSYTFYFGIDRKCTVQWKTGIGDPVSIERKYEYKYPNIIISLADGNGVYATGYIENEIMYMEIDSKILELKKIR